MSEIKKCPHCHKEIPSDANFCIFCMQIIKEPTKIELNLPRGHKKIKKIAVSAVASVLAIGGIFWAFYAFENSGDISPEVADNKAETTANSEDNVIEPQTDATSTTPEELPVKRVYSMISPEENYQVDYGSGIVDGMYYDIYDVTTPFVNDENVIGSWNEISAMYIAPNQDINTIVKNYFNEFELTLIYERKNSITFCDNGTFYYTILDDDINKSLVSVWDKGYIVSENSYVRNYTSEDENMSICTLEQYYLIEADGESYLFIEYKNGDYRDFGETTAFRVYKKTESIPLNDTIDYSEVYKATGNRNLNTPNSSSSSSNTTSSVTSREVVAPSAYSIPFEQTKTEDGFYYDKVGNYTFTCDDYILGEWKKVGYLNSGKSLEETAKTCSLDISIISLGVLDIDYYNFSDNGIVYCTRVFSDNDVMNWESEWSMGSIVTYELDLKKISNYIVVNSNGVDYMILELKNGDYVRDGEVPCYDVLIRNS